jgi:hypothetical protein
MRQPVILKTDRHTWSDLNGKMPDSWNDHTLWKFEFIDMKTRPTTCNNLHVHRQWISGSNGRNVCGGLIIPTSVPVQQWAHRGPECKHKCPMKTVPTFWTSECGSALLHVSRVTWFSLTLHTTSLWSSPAWTRWRWTQPWQAMDHSFLPARVTSFSIFV